MFQKRFVIGSINQGKAKVGDTFSAYEQNTIFLSGVCVADDFLDEPAKRPKARALLKSVGSLCLNICSIEDTEDGIRVANLDMEEDSKERYQAAMEYLFRDNIIGYFHQDPPLMTLTPMTALEVGDQLKVSYFSVMQPLNKGLYVLWHDYPTERKQGPRFEKFEEL